MFSLLTSKEFLILYDKLFINKCEIIQKTDNLDLFNYSLESLKDYGYEITSLIYDLHSTNIENITTEYEERFSKEGIKIKYLKAIK